MNILIKAIKKILCKHDYEVIKEVEIVIGYATAVKCTLCNKTKILVEYTD